MRTVSPVIEADGHEVGVGMREESVVVMRAVIPIGRARSAEVAMEAIFILCLLEADYLKSDRTGYGDYGFLIWLH